MKKIILFAASLMAAFSCATIDERNAGVLAERIVPGYDIGFEQLEDTVDVFEIRMKGDRVVISGNNANSMAVGLNHYLKNYCDVTVSWFAYDPVRYPAVMPPVPEPVRVEARTDERFPGRTDPDVRNRPYIWSGPLQ